jgi:hypothetical protein
MSKRSLALVALVPVVAAMFMSSLTVRAQSPARIEYVRVTPYTTRTPVGPNAVQERVGYRACVAGAAEWTCRDFQPTPSSADALRTALVTLGNEGWELVSVVEDDLNANARGLMYLFKRPAR